MYWINLAALESQVINNRLTDEKALPYFIVQSVLILILMSLPYNASLKDKFIWLDILTGIFLTLWGIRLNFNTYTQRGGKEFFKIYWAIGWVVSIRLLLHVFLVCIIGIILFALILEANSSWESFYLEDYINKKLLLTISTIITTMLYYHLVNRSLKRVVEDK